MALPFLVLYLTRHLQVPATLAGLALSIYGIGGIVTAPFAGRLSDRIGPFTVMRASLALTGIILFIIPLAHNLAVVFALIFLWAIVAEGARPAIMSSLTSATSPVGPGRSGWRPAPRDATSAGTTAQATPLAR